MSIFYIRKFICAINISFLFLLLPLSAGFQVCSKGIMNVEEKKVLVKGFQETLLRMYEECAKLTVPTLGTNVYYIPSSVDRISKEIYGPKFAESLRKEKEQILEAISLISFKAFLFDSQATGRDACVLEEQVKLLEKRGRDCIEAIKQFSQDVRNPQGPAWRLPVRFDG